MHRFDGSLARQLDFGDVTTSTFPLPRPLKAGATRSSSLPTVLKLARGEAVRGPDKYKVLEHRRRQAQIKARRLLDLL